MQKKIYVNTTKYNRLSDEQKVKHRYTVISNLLINDERLSFTEKGMMIWILSNSDDYIFNSEYVQKYISGIGEDSYYKCMKHLQELGYIQKTKKLKGFDWIINETTFKISDIQETGENTSSKNPNQENTIRENTSSESTILENTGITTNNSNESLNKEKPIERIEKEKITNETPKSENKKRDTEQGKKELNSSDYKTEFFNQACYNKIFQFYKTVVNDYHIKIPYSKFEKVLLFMIYMTDSKEIVDNNSLNRFVYREHIYVQKQELIEQLEICRTSTKVQDKINELSEKFKKQ